MFLEDVLKLRVERTGSVGAAAANIQGFTLHSLFEISDFHKQMLTGFKSLFGNFMNDLDVVIIEEFSMLTTDMLTTLD
jgi:hypothetical protein